MNTTLVHRSLYTKFKHVVDLAYNIQTLWDQTLHRWVKYSDMFFCENLTAYRKDLVTLNSFLVVQVCHFASLLCNWSRTHCTLLHNGMQNHSAPFWLANTKPRQLTLYSIAVWPDAISHGNCRAAIWLAYVKTGMLSLQEPRKRSTVTRPFSSFEGGVWRRY